MVAGGVFTKTEMSEVLTEIVKMDPTFDKEQFIKQCQFDMIPNILEVCVQSSWV
jgi:mitochondrial import inner membrane translocase subunit TIM44